MMPPTISRRGLLAVASTGAMACLSAFLSLFRGYSEGTSSGTDSDLVALCSDLCCPRTVGKACLLALPASESTRSSLARAILADLRLAQRNHSPSDVFAQAISERSRTDFRGGRVVTVDGWILSLTETRIYALAALLREAHVHVV